MTPPPLAWLHSFCVSTSGALGQQVVFKSKGTVNPLVHIVTISWQENISNAIVLQIWNLLQMWLTKNNCIPYGGITTKATSLIIQVIVKRRLGNPKDETP